MALFSKAHYDLLEMFERDFKNSSVRGRLDREDKALWAKGHIYLDGAVNDLFVMYRAGFAYGEAVSR